METIQIIILFTVFFTMAVLMFLRKLPAIIALPVMAVLIALVGGVSIQDTIRYVIGMGSLKLSAAITISIFGSMLSVLMQKTGVAESFIKRGAELSGDNPWTIAVVMLSLIIVLFSTLGGLGAIIMVATIVLPIMSSVGIGPITTVGVFLFGLSIGGLMNVGNWAVYISVMGLTVEQIRPFALVMFSISFLTALIYITIQLYRDGNNLNIRRIFLRNLLLVSIGSLIIYGYFEWLTAEAQDSVLKFISGTGTFLSWLVVAGIILLFGIAIVRLLHRKNEQTNEVHWSALFAPTIPLMFILVFSMDFIASFVIGLVFTFIATYKRGRLNIFIQSMFEGGAVVMPAVALMFGIGMLLVAIMGPGGSLEAYPDGWPVIRILKPLMMTVVPSNPFEYVFFFTLAAPLALYRGPFNVWGMGYGLAGVFLASGLNPGAVMGLLLGVGHIQGISDPTNTQNVWLANEMRIDVQKILWNTIPYTWILAFIGLTCSAIMFM
jgi:H+/gluconate symporter-like permease